MPALARWYIKTSFVYLTVSLMVGVALGARGVLLSSPLLDAFLPVYFHLFMVGWVAQLIFGVAYWMFPTYSREHPRGSEKLAAATYVMLNAGLLLRAIGEPLNTLSPAPAWGWTLVVSAGLQWLAGVVFVANTWGRVRGR